MSSLYQMILTYDNIYYMKQSYSKTGLRFAIIYGLGILIPIIFSYTHWGVFTLGIISLMPWGMVINIIGSVVDRSFTSFLIIDIVSTILNIITVYFLGKFFEYLSQSKVRAVGMILSAVSYTVLFFFLVCQIIMTLMTIFGTPLKY